MNITGVPHKIKLTLNPADAYVLGTWFLPMCIHPTTVHERVRVSILREVAVRFEKKLISVPKQQVTMQLPYYEAWALCEFMKQGGFGDSVFQSLRVNILMQLERYFAQPAGTAVAP